LGKVEFDRRDGRADRHFEFVSIRVREANDRDTDPSVPCRAQIRTCLDEVEERVDQLALAARLLRVLARRARDVLGLQGLDHPARRRRRRLVHVRREADDLCTRASASASASAVTLSL
jgi:hypothetical protein